MEIEFQTTKTDYKSFYRYYYRNKLQKNIVSVILIALVIGYVFTGQPFQFSKFIYGTIISTFLLTGIVFLAPYLISLNSVYKLVSKNSKYLEKKKLTIADGGLYFEAKTENGTWKWESIVEFDSNIKFIYFFLADKKLCLIPKSAFLSDNEATEFIRVFQGKLFRRTELINPLPGKSTGNPPYLLGLICLIPFVGAFVGVVFIILGATRFKDNWFTLIGAFGITFTVVIYSTVFQAGKHASVFKNGFKELSKMQVSNLVKDIEFYKLQNGQYPDSLKQLQVDNKSAFIYDPLQASQGRQSNLFYYLKVGNKYKLFSSGEDGIPCTVDDFYPQVSAKVISKIGLLKYELKPDTSKQTANH